MPARNLTLACRTPQETAAFGAALAELLEAGDTLLLSGDLGTGKSHLARSLIRAHIGAAEDVPSPTFTLVQTYDTPAFEIWHADLYRLGSVQEVEELGLTEAFDTAVCLIEWPDRLGTLVPENALSIGLQPGPADDARQLTLTWCDGRWDGKLAEWR